MRGVTLKISLPDRIYAVTERLYKIAEEIRPTNEDAASGLLAARHTLFDIGKDAETSAREIKKLAWRIGGNEDTINQGRIDSNG